MTEGIVRAPRSGGVWLRCSMTCLIDASDCYVRLRISTSMSLTIFLPEYLYLGLYYIVDVDVDIPVPIRY